MTVLQRIQENLQSVNMIEADPLAPFSVREGEEVLGTLTSEEGKRIFFRLQEIEEVRQKMSEDNFLVLWNGSPEEKRKLAHDAAALKLEAELISAILWNLIETEFDLDPENAYHLALRCSWQVVRIPNPPQAPPMGVATVYGPLGG